MSSMSLSFLILNALATKSGLSWTAAPFSWVDGDEQVWLVVFPADGHSVLKLGIVPSRAPHIGAGQNLLANPRIVIISIHSICHWGKLQLPGIEHLTDVAIGVGTEVFLILSLVVQLLVLGGNPANAEKLLEEPSTHEQVVTRFVAYIHVVGEELSWGDPSVAVGVGGLLVPSFGSIGEQQGEVERHCTRIQVGDTLQSTSSDLEDQIVRMGIGQDAHFTQGRLQVVSSRVGIWWLCLGTDDQLAFQQLFLRSLTDHLEVANIGIDFLYQFLHLLKSGIDDVSVSLG